MLLEYSDKVSPMYGQHLKEDCSKRTKPMKIGETVEKVVRTAWRENRLVVGVLEVATFLQNAVRGSALVCVLQEGPGTSVGDLCQHRLVEAFCREHRIRLVKVQGEQSLIEKNDDDVADDDDDNNDSVFLEKMHTQNESQAKIETLSTPLQMVDDVIYTTKKTTGIRRRNSLSDISTSMNRPCDQLRHRRIARNHSFPKIQRNEPSMVPSSGKATCFLVKAEERVSSEEDFVIAFHDIYRCSSVHVDQFPCVQVGRC